MQGRSIRRSIAVLFAMVLVLGSLTLLGCSGGISPEGGASSGSGVVEPESGTTEVTMIIDISAAVAENDPTALELEKTQGSEYTMQVKVPEGASIMEVLDASGVDYVLTSMTGGSYVSGINGLLAGSAGPESGWTYLLNGEFSIEAAGDAVVNAGDTVLWQYVTKYE